VLHGASGIPDEDIKKAISCGIAKININTDLQIVWSKKVREFLSVNQDVYDPRIIIKAGETDFKKLVSEKLALTGSTNKL
ncbi:MAG: class II fructose-bisphosphate aldolase, partial [Bacilli bacterium]|nr:class II fructose-bisphosphate aldolase [Bacilli bacterium]